MMVEKGIRGRICHAIHRYAKANNHVFRCKQLILMGNVSKITCEWFQMENNVSKFYEFIKNYDKDSNKGYIFEVDVEYPED